MSLLDRILRRGKRENQKPNDQTIPNDNKLNDQMLLIDYEDNKQKSQTRVVEDDQKIIEQHPGFDQSAQIQTKAKASPKEPTVDEKDSREQDYTIVQEPQMQLLDNEKKPTSPELPEIQVSLLRELNNEQREAVTTTEGFVRVIAGAGSGKTRALTYRYAYLVNIIGVPPKNILCSTFTNKAANEMRQRIRILTGGQDTGYVCTFHSLCVAILQEDGHFFHYPKNFRVLDNSDVNDILGNIYEESGFTSRNMTYKAAVEMIGHAKNGAHADYFIDMISMSLDDLKTKYQEAESINDRIFYGYVYHEKKMFALDFNDLIVLTIYLFEQAPEIKEKWQKRFQYVMVDEYQDISPAQKAIMDILSDYHRNLFVVGDSDQTIYSWRGSNIAFMQNFAEDHDGTKTVFMNRNYRSTPEIIAVCNSLIEKNYNRIKKELESCSPLGQPVHCCYAKSVDEESKWIGEEIGKLHHTGIPYKDIAILYRAHYVTRAVEQALLGEEIPYRIYSGPAFYERKEIKDTLSYLSMLVYQDDLSFQRVINTPKRNIGKKRMGFLKEYAEQHGCTLYDALKSNLSMNLIMNSEGEAFVSLIDSLSKEAQSKLPSEILSTILDKSGYEEMLRTEGDQDRLDNLAELKMSVFEYETTGGEEVSLVDYLQHIALLTNQDFGGTKDKVKMMTIHAAKGLEFPFVFVCSLNEGVIPTKRSDTFDKIEEERRLAFVAMSRAEKGLYLSCSEGFDYEGMARYPSRFLLDIEKDLLVYDQEPSERLIEDAKSYIKLRDHAMMNKGNLFYSVGQRVKHSVFGLGTIVAVNEEEGNYTIKFDNMETERSLSSKTFLDSIG